MEIERKFLIKEIPNNIISQPLEIIQGYLCFDPEIRIRNINNQKYFLTIKTNVCSLARHECEIEIPKSVYLNLVKIVKSTITKTRTHIELENNLIAEIDTYDNGLIVVEVEFKTVEEAEKFIPPYWFGEDVTNNKIYKNVNLAKKL